MSGTKAGGLNALQRINLNRMTTSINELDQSVAKRVTQTKVLDQIMKEPQPQAIKDAAQRDLNNEYKRLIVRSLR